MLDTQEVPLRRRKMRRRRCSVTMGGPGKTKLELRGVPAQCLSVSVCVIPQLWGRAAQQTAAGPGSGSAWWSGTSGRWSAAAEWRVESSGCFLHFRVTQQKQYRPLRLSAHCSASAGGFCLLTGCAVVASGRG